MPRPGAGHPYRQNNIEGARAMSIRTVRSIIEGQALLTAAANLPVADAAATRELRTTVRLRNDQLAGRCPA